MKKGLFAILVVLTVFALVMTGCPDPGGGGGGGKVKITFDGNGGTVSQATKEVNKGTAAGTLPTATKDGSTHIGWATSAAATTANFTSATIVNADITVFAVYEDGDPTSPVNPGYTVPTYPPLATDNDIVEEITLNNGWAALFQFVLPEGRHWEDYAGITVQYKIDDVSTEARARMWGNYVPVEVAAATFGSYNGKNIAVVGSWPGGSSGRWIMDNTYGTIKAVSELFGANATPTPANDTWFTVKYLTDASGAHGDWTAGTTPGNANFLVGRDPAGGGGLYAGPFYFGLGLSFGNDGGAKSITSQIKNVTLKGFDTTIPDVIGMPLYFKSASGALYRAFVGQLDGDKANGLSPNFNSGKPAFEIKGGETKITAAAITGLAPAPPETVKITFKANYASGDADFADQPADTFITIVKGATAPLPALKRSGFTFLGWFDAATAGNKKGATSTFDAATTLYAQWKVFNLPNKLIVEGADLDDLIEPAWGAVVGTGDAAGYIIMAGADWNNTDHSNNNDSLINISFPEGLSDDFNMFKIYYEYKQIAAPASVPDGWTVDAAGIAKIYNTGNNAGNPSSFFSFNQSGGVLDRTFNDNVTVETGMSIQINKGDDDSNKQKRAGLVYGIKITKLEFLYRESTVVEGNDLNTLVTAAWGAKKDADGFVIMADEDWNEINGAPYKADSLLNISFPAGLDDKFDKIIVTYSYKLVENAVLGAGEEDYTIDAAGIAKKYNDSTSAANCIGSTGSAASPGSYFSFSKTGGTMYFITNTNVTLTSGMAIQINKNDDASNKQKRAGLVYGIKITKLEFYIESPLAP
jgi:hypothetical protein